MSPKSKTPPARCPVGAMTKKTKAYSGPRVLMLLENNPYPQDGRVYREATALTAAGYRVSVICPMATGQPPRENIASVQVYRYSAPRAGNGLWGYIWEYSYSMLAVFFLSLRISVCEGFDLIHAHNPPDTFVLIASLYKLLGKRFVFDHHDLSPDLYFARFSGQGHPAVYRALLLLEKWSCRLADLVIATNESYKRVEMQRDEVREERIAVVRNGPGLDVFQPVAFEKKGNRQERTMLGYVGSIGFHDGLDYLVRALQHLVFDLQRTDVFCLVAGDGDALPYVRKLREEAGLSEYVSFIGRIPHADVPRHMSAADICLAPEPSNSYNDRSTIIKLMEYMALGKPIVAFDLPEHRLTAQAAALYARPNDELAFAEIVAELMDDPIRREAMGAFGRWRVETALAWEYSASKLVAAYRQLFSAQGEKVSTAKPHSHLMPPKDSAPPRSRRGSCSPNAVTEQAEEPGFPR